MQAGEGNFTPGLLLGRIVIRDLCDAREGGLARFKAKLRFPICHSSTRHIVGIRHQRGRALTFSALRLTQYRINGRAGLLARRLLKFMMLNGTARCHAILRAINGLRTGRLINLKRFNAFRGNSRASIRLFGILRDSILTSKFNLMDRFFINLLHVRRFLCLYFSDLILCLLRRRLELYRAIANDRRIHASRLYPLRAFRIRRLTRFLATRQRRELGNGHRINHRLRKGVGSNLSAFQVNLRRLPQFTINGMLIASAYRIRNFLLNITRLRSVRRLFRLNLRVLRLIRDLTIMVNRFTAFKRRALVVFLHRLRNAIRGIGMGDRRLIVIAYLRVLPNGIIILNLKNVNHRRVTRCVLLTKRITGVFIRPSDPITKYKGLITFRIRRLVTQRIIQRSVATLNFRRNQRRGTIRRSVILTSRIGRATFKIFPPLLPHIKRRFFHITSMASEHVRPRVGRLTFNTFCQCKSSPVRIATSNAKLRTRVGPTLTLTMRVIPPLLIILRGPFALPDLVLIRQRVPIFHLARRQLQATSNALQVSGIHKQRKDSTLLTLIAVDSLNVAIKAFAHSMAINRRHVDLLIVVLRKDLFRGFTFLVRHARGLQYHLAVRLEDNASMDIG